MRLLSSIFVLIVGVFLAIMALGSAEAYFTISLSSPTNGGELLDNSVDYTFTTLSNYSTFSCSLYSNTSGSFALISTNSSVSNNTATTFSQSSLSDGTYSWNVFCNHSSEPAGDWASQNYSVIIDYVNQNPSISSIPNQTVSTGSTMAYQVVASDPDGDTIIYSVNDTAVSISSSGLITYSSSTPIQKPVRVTVSDGRGGSAYTDFEIGVVSSGDSISISSSKVTFSEDDRGENYTQQFNVVNSGTTALTGINIVSGLPSKYEASFSNVPSSLSAGQSQAVSLTIFYPDDLDAEQKKIGYFYATSNQASSSNIDVYAEGRNELQVSDLDFVGIGETGSDTNVHGDDNFEMNVYPGDDMIVSIEVKNDFSDSDDYDFDLEDIEIEFVIEDMDDGSDIEFTKEISSLAARGEKVVEFEFMIPYAVQDEEEFDMTITIEAEDENSASHKWTYEGIFVAQRDNHNLDFVNVQISPDSISCERAVTATATVINLGRHDEDESALVIENTELGLFERYDFEMGNEFDDEDNQKVVSKTFTIPTYAKSKDYYIDFRLFYEVSTEHMRIPVRLTVGDCFDEPETEEEETNSDEDDEEEDQTDGGISTTIGTGSDGNAGSTISNQVNPQFEDIVVSRVTRSEDEGLSNVAIVGILAAFTLLFAGVMAAIYSVVGGAGTGAAAAGTGLVKSGAAASSSKVPTSTKDMKKIDIIRNSTKTAESLLHETIEIIEADDADVSKLK